MENPISSAKTDNNKFNDNNTLRIPSREEDRDSVCSDSTTHSEKEKTDEYVSKAGSTQRDSLLGSEDISPAEKPRDMSPIFELTLTLFDGETVDFKISEVVIFASVGCDLTFH